MKQWTEMKRIRDWFKIIDFESYYLVSCFLLYTSFMSLDMAIR